VREVVEGEQHVGHHQREVGDTDVVRVRPADRRLEPAHEVVPEQADGATRERRQVRQLGQAVARELLGDRLVRVVELARLAVHGQDAPVEPDHAAGLDAEERPAAEPLALLGRLEQEARTGAAQLEVSRHRRLAVVDERVAKRNERVVARKLAHLVPAGTDVEARGVSGDGH
jgi:hypothetical protein